MIGRLRSVTSDGSSAFGPGATFPARSGNEQRCLRLERSAKLSVLDSGQLTLSDCAGIVDVRTQKMCPFGRRGTVRAGRTLRVDRPGHARNQDPPTTRPGGSRRIACRVPSVSISVPPTRSSPSWRAASRPSSPTPKAPAPPRPSSRSPRTARCWSVRSPSVRRSPTSTGPSVRSSVTWAPTGPSTSTARRTPRRRSAPGCWASSSATPSPTWASRSSTPSSPFRRTSTTPSARPPRRPARSRASTCCASSTSRPRPRWPTAWTRATRSRPSWSSTSVVARSTCRCWRSATASSRSRRPPATTSSAATTGTSGSSSGWSTSSSWPMAST